jgi:hypothetical protein
MEDDLPLTHPRKTQILPSSTAPARRPPRASTDGTATARSAGTSTVTLRSSSEASTSAAARSASAASSALADAAGICNGVHTECSPSGRGIRHAAQLRLTGCRVEYERLKSTTAADRSADAERSCRDIRRLMRQMYGEPDQDYEDWQIVVMSDMESGAILMALTSR